MGDEQQGHAAGVVAGDDTAARVVRLEQQLVEARQAALVSRDHAVGVEAEVGRQNAEILRLAVELRRAEARAKRLAERKRSQARRIAGLEAQVATTRKRNAALTQRVRELEGPAVRPSLARRVARRLRGSGR